MQISRQTMQLQTVEILKALFALPGFDSVSIKGISPASPDDSQAVLSAIDASWHDISAMWILRSGLQSPLHCAAWQNR